MFRSMSLVKTPPRVSTPRESGRHVEEQDVLDLAGEDAALDRRRPWRRTPSGRRRARWAGRCCLDELLDDRHPGRAADQDDPVDLVLARASRRVIACSTGALHRSTIGRIELLELGAVERQREVLRALVRSPSGTGG